MDGRKLILADGTEYESGEAGYSEGHVWLYLPPTTDMFTAFEDFSNTEKTSRITFVYGTGRSEYDGFTDFRGIMRNGDGLVNVHLARAQREEG